MNALPRRGRPTPGAFSRTRTRGRRQNVEQDLDTPEKLAITIKETSLCGLGQTAPNPRAHHPRYFRKEYLEHISRKKNAVCPPPAKASSFRPCENPAPIHMNIPGYLNC